MKALKWIAYISADIGALFVLIGLIQLVFGRFIQGAEIINYFHAANSFFLITIVIFLYIHLIQNNKE